MMAHAFVPSDFCFSMIVPLLKDKHGDASRLDMYRGITLSSAVSKLFVSVLVTIYGDSLYRVVTYSFGLKKHCCHAFSLLMKLCGIL